MLHLSVSHPNHHTPGACTRTTPLQLDACIDASIAASDTEAAAISDPEAAAAGMPADSAPPRAKLAADTGQPKRRR
jgi:hypothetical protein